MSAPTDKSPQAQNRSVSNFDAEAQHNLIGFFQLLLRIDRRVNPHLYVNAHLRSPNPANQS